MCNRKPMLGLVLHTHWEYAKRIVGYVWKFSVKVWRFTVKVRFFTVRKKKLLLPFTGQIPVSKEQSIRTHFLHEIQSESKAWRRVGHENTETVPRHKRTLSTWFAISSALASIVFLLPNFLYWKKPLFHLVSHLTTCHEQKKILHLKKCLTCD